MTPARPAPSCAPHAGLAALASRISGRLIGGRRGKMAAARKAVHVAAGSLANNQVCRGLRAESHGLLAIAFRTSWLPARTRARRAGPALETINPSNTSPAGDPPWEAHPGHPSFFLFFSHLQHLVQPSGRNHEPASIPQRHGRGRGPCVSGCCCRCRFPTCRFPADNRHRHRPDDRARPN